MSRTEKVIAFLLSALVFAGLFFFIHSSLRAPVNAPPLTEPDYYGDEDDTFDFEDEISTQPVSGEPTDAALERKPAPAPAAATKK